MKSRLKGPVEWVDPYEFLVAVKKEPTLSNLALGILHLSLSYHYHIILSNQY